MDDYAASLQQGIYNALRADPALNTLFATTPRVYDRVPKAQGLEFPYIRIGEDDLTEIDLTCATFAEITSRIHVFSRTTGKVECKNITGAVREALKTSFPLQNYELANSQFIKSHFLTDPDGLTEHGYVEFIFTISNI